jgi:hypothetical protein
MKETGILENLTLLSLVLPGSEPGLLVEYFQLGQAFWWCPAPIFATVPRHRLTRVFHDLFPPP